jgi:tetratricopeptide (TPR) repeat protein
VQPQPDNPQAYCAQAAALQDARRYREAAAVFQRAVELAPDCVEALTGQAECSLELGDFEDARDCFELALAHALANVRAQCGLGRLLRAAGDIAGSIEHLRAAAQRLPNDADILFELALSLNRGDDATAALDAYQRAIAINPAHHGALVNCGLVYLSQLGEPQRAADCFRAAIAAYPQSVAAQANLGLALQEQGQPAEALAHYERLLARDPAVIEYRWNRGLAHLLQGNFARGWADYELRHVRGGRDVRRDFGLPEWDGRVPAQPQLLVYGEQGVGDEIMFAACLPDLARRVAGVVLECDARLAPLFKRSFPQISVHGAAREGGREWLRQYPALDHQIAIGSLPRLLRKRREDFPPHAGYLQPDTACVAGWRQRLAGDGAPVIGLAWRGGTRKTRAGLRSLELRDCLPLAGARRGRFVCLQRGDCNDEIATARAAGLDLQWWPEALQDLEETAALIAALDGVVSVDNTSVHLAGALGVPALVMLTYMPDWRYGLAGASMPWYPSLRLFRQSAQRDWAPVVEAVAAALSSLPAGGGVPRD